jgi:ABC-2 type transport system permease protein
VYKWWLIFKREYITRVRTKGFVIATIAIPLLTSGIMGASIYLAIRQNTRSMKITILDNAGGFADSIATGLTKTLPNGKPAFQVVKKIERPASEEGVRKELLDEVNSGALDAYLVLPKEGAAAKSAEFHTKNTGDFTLEGLVARAVSNSFVERRLGDHGVKVDNLDDLLRGVDVKMVKVTKEGETEEKGQTFVVGLILMMLLYTMLVMYGIVTMRSVLEEKTTRIVEILISAVTPFQLLAGKIIGVAAVAFTQYFIWISTAVLIGAYGGAIASAYSPGTSITSFHIPGFVLIASVIYFLLGYFLYASLYAAIGAASSNEQDAQQLQLPATLPLVVSFVMWNVILRDASSTTSIVLSEIPFFSPILMLLRISIQTPPLWQIGLSVVLMILTTFGVVYFSSRIYRVGILMYGKRPSLVEILRWLKYS